MKISIQVRGGKTVERTVRRRQFPVETAAGYTNNGTPPKLGQRHTGRSNDTLSDKATHIGL